MADSDVEESIEELIEKLPDLSPDLFDLEHLVEICMFDDPSELHFFVDLCNTFMKSFRSEFLLTKIEDLMYVR